MKKAQGVQFNWIFILVAGGIILGFFVMFTFRYVDLENKKNIVTTGRYIVEGLQILETTQLDTTIDLIYYSKLKFSCEKTKKINKITINDYYPQDLNEITFAPSELKTNKINAWVKTWNYPFKISNFLFISSPHDKYILVNPPDWIEIPERMNIKKINKGEKIENATRVVFFDPSMMPSKTELTGIREKSIAIGEDEIRFFNKKGFNNIKINDDIFKYGAIFSNYDNFECNLNKALEKLKIIAKIYSNKAYLLSIIDTRGECDYSLIKNQLDKVAETEITEIDKEVIKGLEQQNMDLVGRGCYNVF